MYWHGQIDSKAKWNEKHTAEQYYYRDPRIRKNSPAYTDIDPHILEEGNSKAHQGTLNLFKELANRKVDENGVMHRRLTFNDENAQTIERAEYL